LIRELELEFEKETKGTWRFKELKTSFVNTIYIQKSAFDTKPEKIKVTIETIE